MYRMERVNSELMKSLLKIIPTMSDKRIAEKMISISYVSTAPDLKTARIGIVVLGSDNAKSVVKLLNSSKGFIRHEIAEMMNLKTTPDLNFVVDDTEERASRIDELLKKISTEN